MLVLPEVDIEIKLVPEVDIEIKHSFSSGFITGCNCYDVIASSSLDPSSVER